MTHRNFFPCFFVLALISWDGLADRAWGAEVVSSNRQTVGEMPDLESQTHGQILEVKADGTVIVRDLSDGKFRSFQLTKGVSLRAQSPREFGGRRRLVVDDLKPGRILRIKLRYPYNRVQRVYALRWGKIPRTAVEPDPYDSPRLPPPAAAR